MSNEIKKKQIDEIIDDIRTAAHTLVDGGVPHDPAFIVMDLAYGAYEFEEIRKYNKKFLQQDVAENNVVQLKPRKGN